MTLSIQFANLSEFFDMGGYAFNVWSVYAAFILFLFINLYFPVLRKRQIINEQKRRLRLSDRNVSEVNEKLEDAHEST